MKYIIMQRQIGELIYEVPIIFPNALVHKHVAQALLHLPGNPYQFKNKVIAAGDINIELGDISCSGRSETLNISSRGAEDEDLIDMIEYGGGIR